MSKEEKLNELLDRFLSDLSISLEDVPNEVLDAFEVSLLLKKGTVNADDFKEEVFEKVFSSYKEMQPFRSYNLFALLLEFLRLIFDFSPFNNNEHLNLSQAYKANDLMIFKIKFSSYLQYRQFMYNYIGSFMLPLGLETLH